MEKPDIEYPCVWPYRVIGKDVVAIRSEVATVLKQYAYTIGSGNSSKNGTYTSIHIEVNVAHEEERNMVFAALKAIPGVKFVV